MSNSSKISIANMALLTVIMLLTWLGVFSFEMILPYRWHKFLHLAGVVVFLGNVILGPLWVVLSLKEKQIETVKFTFKLLQAFDIYVTAPSIFMVVINGLYLGSAIGGIENVVWLKHSVYSLIILWIFIIPILIVQDKMAIHIEKGDITSQAFKQLKTKWMAIGLISFVPLVYICYMMVFKSISI